MKQIKVNGKPKKEKSLTELDKIVKCESSETN